jgi:hypothetical protein
MPWRTNLQGPSVRASSPFTNSWTLAHDIYATEIRVWVLESIPLPFSRICLVHLRSVCMNVHALGIWTKLRSCSNSPLCASWYVDSYEGSTPNGMRWVRSVPWFPSRKTCPALCYSIEEWRTTPTTEDPIHVLLWSKYCVHFPGSTACACNEVIYLEAMRSMMNMMRQT